MEELIIGPVYGLEDSWGKFGNLTSSIKAGVE